MEEDLILGEEEKENPLLDIIDMQLMVISSVSDLDDSLYDDCKAEKILVISNAFKIIHKAQKKLLKEI